MIVGNTPGKVCTACTETLHGFMLLPILRFACVCAFADLDAAILQESDWTRGTVSQGSLSGEALLASRCTDPSEVAGLKQLLGQMLQHDPAKRPSAQDLLLHAWLQP